MVHPVFIQAGAYGLVMVGMILLTGAFLRGFFFRYFKVRTSFGKYVMVKIRTPLRDHFRVGWVDEGFLCYKDKVDGNKSTIRLNIPKKMNPFYRALAVIWCDVDGEKHCICLPDYSVVSGFDAVKHSDLHTRALMRPAMGGMQDKIIIVLLIGCLVASAGAIYLGFLNFDQSQQIMQKLPEMIANVKGVVVKGG